MTHQLLWVILCHLPEKGRREKEEIVEEKEEIVEEMKERGRGEKENEWKWRKRRNKNIPSQSLSAARVAGLAQL